MIIHRLKVAGFRIMGDVTEIEFPEEGRIGILRTERKWKDNALSSNRICSFWTQKRFNSGI